MKDEYPYLTFEQKEPHRSVCMIPNNPFVETKKRCLYHLVKHDSHCLNDTKSKESNSPSLHLDMCFSPIWPKQSCRMYVSFESFNFSRLVFML